MSTVTLNRDHLKGQTPLPNNGNFNRMVCNEIKRVRDRNKVRELYINSSPGQFRLSVVGLSKSVYLKYGDSLENALNELRQVTKLDPISVEDAEGYYALWSKQESKRQERDKYEKLRKDIPAYVKELTDAVEDSELEAFSILFKKCMNALCDMPLSDIVDAQEYTVIIDK